MRREATRMTERDRHADVGMPRDAESDTDPERHRYCLRTTQSSLASPAATIRFMNSISLALHPGHHQPLVSVVSGPRSSQCQPSCFGSAVTCAQDFLEQIVGVVVFSIVTLARSPPRPSATSSSTVPGERITQ